MNNIHIVFHIFLNNVDEKVINLKLSAELHILTSIMQANVISES
jgi:hypothetical protein